MGGYYKGGSIKDSALSQEIIPDGMLDKDAISDSAMTQVAIHDGGRDPRRHSQQSCGLGHHLLLHRNSRSQLQWGCYSGCHP